MTFRSWLEGALRAAGATLLVPLGLVLGIAATATLGGNGVGGLGQLFAGPAIPQARAGEVIRPAGEDGARESLAVPAIPSAAAFTLAATRERPATEHRLQANERRRSEQRRQRRRRPAARRPPAMQPPPSEQPPPSNQPPPPADGPVRVLGASVSNTVRPIPVAGPPAAAVVQTVVDIVDPPPAPVAPAAPAPAPVVPVPSLG